jgi:hypothetical protein
MVARPAGIEARDEIGTRHMDKRACDLLPIMEQGQSLRGLGEGELVG